MPPVDGHDDRPGSPPWVWAALVALALATLTAGAIVGMVTTDDRDGSTAASGTDAAAEPAASVAGDPDRRPTAHRAHSAGHGGAHRHGLHHPDRAGHHDRARRLDGSLERRHVAGGPAGLHRDPRLGRRGAGPCEADSAAQRATAAGLPQVGVLRSSEFPSLRPGWWVVFSGVYGTDARGPRRAASGQAAGFPSAYPRRVAP